MMNARKTFVLSLIVVLTAAGAARAAPVNNKALGIYNSGGWESGGKARSQRSYSNRAPATYRAPAMQSAPAPMVAQAPVEGRRFSYAPSAPAMNASPCPQGQTNAAAPSVQSDRRYSYAPTAEATAPSTRTYSRPSYSSGGGRTSVDRWALPKTDARKYNGR